MAGMADLAFSMAMRDTIDRMVKETLDRERPKYRYGRVKSIDRANYKCTVVFTGETSPVTVNMGSLQPSAIEQLVRIEGIGTDKFITDVIGQWGPGQLIGTVQPFYTAGPVKVTWDGDTTLSGPYKLIASSYNPLPGDRVTGINIPGQGILIIKATDVTTGNLGIPPRWNTILPSQLLNGWSYYTPTPTYPYSGISSGFAWPAFTRTASGIVKMKGLVKSGSANMIFQLPEGFRPAELIMFATERNADIAGRLDVHPDGYVQMTVSDPGWTSLDHISFPAADVAPSSAWTIPVLQNGFRNYSPLNGGVFQGAGWWRDANGIVWETGLIQHPGPAPGNGALVYDKSAQAISPYTLHRRTTSGNGFGVMYQVQNQSATGFYNVSAINYISLAGIPYVPTSSPLNSQWINIPYNTGSDYNASVYPPLQAVKTPDNLVLLRGLVANAASGAIMGILPPGFRPKESLLFGTVSNGAQSRIDIDPAGGIYPRGGTAAAWTSVDGLNFIAEQ